MPTQLSNMPMAVQGLSPLGAMAPFYGASAPSGPGVPSNAIPWTPQASQALQALQGSPIQRLAQQQSQQHYQANQRWAVANSVMTGVPIQQRSQLVKDPGQLDAFVQSKLGAAQITMGPSFTANDLKDVLLSTFGGGY